MSEDNKIQSDDFSLESIMAEYKGSAYISGEKKTPSELLDQQADRIIREVLGDEMVDSLRATVPKVTPQATPPVIPQAASPVMPQAAPPVIPQAAPQVIPQVIPQTTPIDIESLLKDNSPVNIPKSPTAVSAPKSNQLEDTLGFNNPDLLLPELEALIEEETPVRQEKLPEMKVQPVRQESKEDDLIESFFSEYNPSGQDTLSSIGFEVQNAMETNQKSTKSQNKPPAKKAKAERVLFDDETETNFEEKYHEPPLKEAAIKFAKEANSISLRCIPTVVISVMMVILTFAFEANMAIPFGVGRSLALASGMLIFCQLIVMLLCADIVYRGFDYLIKGEPNAETLILFSCVFSFVSGIFTLLGGTPGFLPYSAVSACSLAFAAIGEKYNLRAITDTLKTALSSTEPYGVQGEFNPEVDKIVLKKAYCRTDGFYTNLMRPNISEIVYRVVSPILLIIALLLPLIVIIFREGSEYFLHIFSAFFAAAAPFSALLLFSLPFSVVVKSARKMGAALAGWGGSDDIYHTNGACLTDTDIFPPGTLSINNPRLFSGETLEKSVRYTASIIIASGSGLSNVFSEVLKSDNKSAFRVEEFACAEGGVRGLVRGELVEAGSAAFMNLIGVRVPDGANMKSAVYTAINKKLVVVFPIEYTPVNSVQSALISLLKWRVKLFLAARDFNITPLMLSQKYKVSFEDIELIQTKDSYAFSDANSGKEGRMAAVLVREGLGPYAEVLTGGRLLRISAMFAALLSVFSAFCGILLILYMSWAGAILSAGPGSLLVFMLCMLASVLIVCGYVRCKR